MSDSRMGHGHGHRKPWSEWSSGAKALLIAGVVVGVPCLLALFGAITMWLWNALMPGIFKLPEIGFWQAVGIIVLTQILFKGGPAHRAARSHWKKRQVWQHLREDEAEKA